MSFEYLAGCAVGVILSALIAQQVVCRYFFKFIPAFWPVLGVSFLGLLLSGLSGMGIGYIFGRGGDLTGVVSAALLASATLYTILWRFFVKNPTSSEPLSYRDSFFIVFLEAIIGSIAVGVMVAVMACFR